MVDKQESQDGLHIGLVLLFGLRGVLYRLRQRRSQARIVGDARGVVDDLLRCCFDVVAPNLIETSFGKAGMMSMMCFR